MPEFTGFVAILFSFNCQRQDYHIRKSQEKQKTQKIHKNIGISQKYIVVSNERFLFIISTDV